MINMYEVSETNEMIEHENLDVRTITLGISLLDCIDSDLEELNRKIYDKITETAKDLVSVGRDIEKEFGIPIVNKRISVTPIALVGGAACKSPEDFVTIAKTLDKAAKEVGVNFIGGYSALVSKSMTKSKIPSGKKRMCLQFRIKKKLLQSVKMLIRCMKRLHRILKLHFQCVTALFPVSMICRTCFRIF